MSGEPPATTAPPKAPRRWRRRLLVLAGVLGLLYFFHPYLLKTLASALIAEDASTQVTALLPLAGDRCYLRAAERFREEKCPILLVQKRPGRLVSLGLVPSRVEVARRELLAHEVPTDQLTVLPGEFRDDWELARIVQTWLVAHPDDHVLLLCSRFWSRRMRCILDTVLGKESSRVHLWALADRTFDESNWWHRKSGVLDVFNASLCLAHVCLVGEQKTKPPRWNPDDYERSLRE